jgi:hypothetical protein
LMDYQRTGFRFLATDRVLCPPLPCPDVTQFTEFPSLGAFTLVYQSAMQ